ERSTQMTQSNLILVVGGHDVGKTTIIERIVPKLVERGITVGIIKDIHIEGFSIDTRGKDTWRHAEAGASIVCARGLGETSFITRQQFDLDACVLMLSPHVDFIIAEGFKEHQGRKIIVARELADYNQRIKELKEDDEIIAVAGPFLSTGEYQGDAIKLDTDEGIARLIDQIEPLAKRGKLDRNRLVMPLESAACTLFVNEDPITMKDYIATTLKNIVVGTFASLHWNTHEPVASIHVDINRQGNGSPGKWGMEITLGKRASGDKQVKIKEFVQQSIAAAIMGYVTSLVLPVPAGEIQTCSISIGSHE
nr:molybdopterin-guanine dinucleotide biosynthesis protein B [Candidatus Sigynarchaeota archaeon]